MVNRRGFLKRFFGTAAVAATPAIAKELSSTPVISNTKSDYDTLKEIADALEQDRDYVNIWEACNNNPNGLIKPTQISDFLIKDGRCAVRDDDGNIYLSTDQINWTRFS